jgi:large subunit ribosomal protein L7A
MLEELKKAQNKVIGLKQVTKAAKAEKLAKVYIAEDADGFIKSRLLEDIGKCGLTPVMVPAMKELGEACGIQVGAATAGILK